MCTPAQLFQALVPHSSNETETEIFVFSGHCCSFELGLWRFNRFKVLLDLMLLNDALTLCKVLARKDEVTSFLTLEQS